MIVYDPIDFTMPAMLQLPPLYQYEEIKDDEIRLLILDREGIRGRESDLTGELRTYTLTVDSLDNPQKSSHNEACQYDALSYHWEIDPTSKLGRLP